VKDRIDVHDRQINIIQTKPEDHERLSTAIGGSDFMSRSFCRFSNCGVQLTIAIRHKQDTRFHATILNAALGFGLSVIANFIAEIAVNECGLPM
jgi:hypothetical protein